MMKAKGVSTVIATILMLVITIALAGLAWSYISGFLGSKTGKIVDLVSLDCTTTSMVAVIRNAGNDVISIGTDLQFFGGIDGITLDTTPGCSGDLGQGNSTVCTTIVRTAGSSNIVRIVAPGNSVTGNVICP